MQPKLTADGTLYFIQRPYQPRGSERPSSLAILKDIVFFPFRVGQAAVHFLDFFSMMFTGKPLMTASGPQSPSKDSR